MQQLVVSRWKKHLCAGLLFSLGMSFLCAQTPAIDSLRDAFFQSSHPATQWELSRQLYDAFRATKLDSAYHWTKRGHEVAQAAGDSLLLGKSLYYLGLNAFRKNDFKEALEHFFQAVAILKALDEETWVIDAEYEIGQVYRELQDFPQARRYLDAYYTYHREQQNPEEMIFALTSYSQLQERMGQVDSVLYFGQKALEVAETYQQTQYLAKLHNNLGGGYLYQKSYAQAKDHYAQARQLGSQYDKVSQYYGVYGLGWVYENEGKLDSSWAYYQEAYALIRSYGDTSKESEIAGSLAVLAAKRGAYQSAYQYLAHADSLEDSLAYERNHRDLAELRVQYESQRKETIIAQQALKIEREAKERQTLLLGGLFGLLLLGGLFLFFRNQQLARQRKSEHELALRQAEAEKLREMDQLKSSFFANISHEFRTPLTLLLGPLQDMQAAHSSHSPADISLMIRNGNRLLSLVDQLLDLSRLESGGMKLDLQTGDLRQFLHHLLVSFESLAQQRRIRYEFELPQEAVLARFDPDKLEKILLNLLSNAFKFTPEEGKVQVRTSTEQIDIKTFRLTFAVEDNGPGISAEDLPHIFERFYTQGRDEQGRMGTGIGLALTKELIELSQGKIEVYSPAKQGTTFVVQLHLQWDETEEEGDIAFFSEAREEEKGENKLVSSTGANDSGKRPLVLLIEDHADLLQYLRRHLEADYELLCASNGQQGLALAQEHIPDLIISDVMMPKMDGRELSRQLKTAPATSHIPIILLTALSDQADKLAGLETGADAYLTKPFDQQELRLRVKNLIEQRRMLQARFGGASAHGSISLQLSTVSATEEAFLQRLIALIEANLDNEQLSIEQLAREVALSRSQLHRKIKALTDFSPSVLVRSIRLQHAHHLLEQQVGNVSEVAFRVGIPNLAYFSRCFKAEFGYSPSEVEQA